MEEEIERILMNNFTRGDIKTATQQLVDLFTLSQALPNHNRIRKFVIQWGQKGHYDIELEKSIYKLLDFNYKPTKDDERRI